MKAALVAFSSLLATTLMVGCVGSDASNGTTSAAAAESTGTVVYPQTGEDMSVFPMMNAIVEQKSPSGLDVKLYDVNVAKGSGLGDRLYLGVFEAGVEQLFPLDQTVDQTPTLSFTDDPNQIQISTDTYSASFEVNGANGVLTVEGVDTPISAHTEPDVGDLTVIGGETSVQVDGATTAHLFTMNNTGDNPNHYWLLLSVFDGTNGLSFPLQVDLNTLDKVVPSGRGLSFTGTVNDGIAPETVSYDVQINGDGQTVTVTKQ